MGMMTSRERVLAALRREPTDRVPVFMWFHPSTARRLAALLEIPAGKVGEAMGNDIRQTWVNNNYAMEGIVHENEGDAHTDLWGIHWVRRGGFNQIEGFPLAGLPPEEAARYRFPAEHAEFLLSQMAPLLAARGDAFIGVDVSPCVFEMCWRLRGMEDTLLDMALHPDTAEALLGRCGDFSVMLSVAACERFDVDWLWLGDDVAGQQSLLMSPELWRGMVKPHLKRSADVGLRRGLPVAYHCCGALRNIIPDLVEIGVSVLNPVQCNCPGMEPASLKQEFGRDLAFMGGVDTQGVLPNGTAAEVRRATERLIAGMTSDGGGYILAASHTIPPETPDENIFALYEVAGISREEIFDRAATLRRQV